MTHTKDCKLTEHITGNQFGDGDYDIEYRFVVERDEWPVKGGGTSVWYSADITIGTRWGDHNSYSFGIGSFPGDNETAERAAVVKNMEQFRDDLNKAIEAFKSLE
jgi:hypothetical protein